MEQISNAIMFVDLDLRVTYMNEATRRLLNKQAENFRKIWPTFDPNRMVGQCVDGFHKNPSHQRRLLADGAQAPGQYLILEPDRAFDAYALARQERLLADPV